MHQFFCILHLSVPDIHYTCNDLIRTLTITGKLPPPLWFLRFPECSSRYSDVGATITVHEFQFLCFTFGVQRDYDIKINQDGISVLDGFSAQFIGVKSEGVYCRWRVTANQHQLTCIFVLHFRRILFYNLTDNKLNLFSVSCFTDAFHLATLI